MTDFPKKRPKKVKNSKKLKQPTKNMRVIEIKKSV